MSNIEFKKTKDTIQSWINFVANEIEKELIAKDQHATVDDPNRSEKELMELFDNANNVGHFYFNDFAQPKVALGMAFKLSEDSKIHFQSGNISGALISLKNAQDFLSLVPDRLALKKSQDFISIVHDIKVRGQLEENMESALCDAKNKLATSGAAARHVETHKKRQNIIAYWRTNIGIDQSNEFAAEQLQIKFPDVGHRTLAKYVANAKKLLSAGKV